MAAIMPNYKGTSASARFTHTSTWASREVTDTDELYWYYSEYEKQAIEEQVQREIKKESLNLPGFKIIKKMHNNKKIKSFIENKQMNFNIRNAL